MSANDQSLAELTQLLSEVRARVAARYPEGNATAEGPAGKVTVPLPDLMPLLHARDAAQAKMAAIGSVNPRPSGAVNSAIQATKKTIARALNWFVRDQVAFNREAVACTEATLQALNDVNYALVSLTSQIGHLHGAGMESGGGAAAQDVRDLRAHWAEWRPYWEEKLGQTEAQLLRTIADLQRANEARVAELTSAFDARVRVQHEEFQQALADSAANIQKQAWSDGEQLQKRLWEDLDRVRADYERIIHTELRVIRQKGFATVAPAPERREPNEIPCFDPQGFAEKFRGPEEWVHRNRSLYLPHFAGCRQVLDIGCGRGEMLEDLKAAGIPAKGIDLNADSVAYCQSRGLDAERADLFDYLRNLADHSLDGIFCSQVVEHLPPARVAEMIALCGLKVKPDSVIAVETPNPECLAIFATHFYLDPTHQKPVPPALLSFYLVEAGFRVLETQYLSPAAEAFPELNGLPPDVVKRFFGGMDYATIARKL